MKKSILVVSLLFGTMFTTQAVAEEGRGVVGISSYSLMITRSFTVGSATLSQDTTYTGSALVLGYNVTDSMSVDGSIYALTDDKNSNSTMNGFDAAVRFGPNDLGFTYYGALGVYSETGENSATNISKDYSGALFGGGIGYNWDSVNWNWNILSIRPTGDYQGNDPADYTAFNAGMSIAYRF